MTKEAIDTALRAQFPHLIEDARSVDRGELPTPHYILTRKIFLEIRPAGLDHSSLECAQLLLEAATLAARQLARPGISKKT